MGEIKRVRERCPERKAATSSGNSNMHDQVAANVSKIGTTGQGKAAVVTTASPHIKSPQTEKS